MLIKDNIRYETKEEEFERLELQLELQEDGSMWDHYWYVNKDLSW